MSSPDAPPPSTTPDAAAEAGVEAGGGDDGVGDDEAAAPADVVMADGSESSSTPPDTGGGDTTVPDAALVVDPDAAPPGTFCSLPGSIVWNDQGPALIPGGDPSAPDMSWLRVPSGFCVHPFATVHVVRQLKFAPGGELFASSPTAGTTGGGSNGGAAIYVLPDDDHNGAADGASVFLPGLSSVQGLMFAPGFFYYQDGSVIRRIPYATGDRQPSGAAEVVTDMSSALPQDALHWPKVFDTAQDGTIYITNGGSQADVCMSSWPVRGAVVKLNPSDHTTSVVATGFRNPIAMRCEQDHDVCLVVELALDYSGDSGGREKVIPLRQGDNWGFPCCATQNLPNASVHYSDTGATPDCSGVATDTDSFIIGHTPFGIDFAPTGWPAPWNSRAFVTLHGIFGSWSGARVVAIARDPATGLLLPATELDGGSGTDPSNLLDFATGWDDGRQDRGRPAPITFAPDGRLFLGDDQRGAIVWIAPVNLPLSP